MHKANLLTPPKLQAMQAYDRILNEYPNLFSPRAHRPIVTNRQIREAYAQEHDCLLGVIAETPYFYVLSDLLEIRQTGGLLKYFVYSRIVQRAQLAGARGVAIFATNNNPQLGAIGAILVLSQERHATGTIELEIPRGFGTPGMSEEENALREMHEETGYTGTIVQRLGEILPDSGMQDSSVVIYHINISARIQAAPEDTEAIQHTMLLSPEQLRQSIREGKCRDSFTLAAWSFYQSFTT